MTTIDRASEARERLAAKHLAARARIAMEQSLNPEAAAAAVLRGPQGPEGPQGEPGTSGVDGGPGRDGLDGQDGHDGADGKAGPRGSAGRRGEQGEKGDPGETCDGTHTDSYGNKSPRGLYANIPSPGTPGAPGVGVPAGGTAGQYLRKTSATDYADAWAPIASSEVTGLGTLAGQNGTFSGVSSGTNTGDQTITLTGDITGSGTGSFPTTLPTVNPNVGTFGDATHVAAVTVNAKGQVTAVSAVPITGGGSSSRTFAYFAA